MNQTAASGQSKAKNTLPLGWFVGVAILLFLAFLSLLFNNTTELTPSHDRALNACLAVAALSGLVCVGLCIRDSKEMTAPRRVLLAPLVRIFVFITVFVTSSAAAQMVEGFIDFPPGRTITYKNALLPISRAYHVHVKGQTWHIQTPTPIWGDFTITRDDYQFMLAHRRPGDTGHDPDEIASQGYFCARVTVERAGNAVRVMHAGMRTLPLGTVVVCPSLAGR